MRGDGGGHESLSESHHVADEHAVALVQMVSGNLDRSGLEVEQAVPEHLRDPELSEARAGLVREVVGHLEVDVVRRNQGLPAPSSPR